MTVQTRPIDPAARNGRFHLVIDDQGHQHSARWTGAAWAYSSGVPVGRNVVNYAVNRL